MILFFDEVWSSEESGELGTVYKCFGRGLHAAKARAEKIPTRQQPLITDFNQIFAFLRVPPRDDLLLMGFGSSGFVARTKRYANKAMAYEISPRTCAIEIYIEERPGIDGRSLTPVQMACTKEVR
jgi:hypothetical protein